MPLKRQFPLGEVMAKRYYKEGYAGMKGRSAQESSDKGMMSSGGGFANMPQNVIQRAWPVVGYNMPEGLNDTLSGIDKQIKDDMKRKKPINSEKY